MLKVWGRRNSFNVQKVLWFIAELGLEFEHIPAGGEFGGLDEPAFRALNPHGKVPAILDGDLAVWESHSILRYLAARHESTAFKGDLANRYRIEPWMDWSLTTFEPTFAAGLLWGYFRTPEERRDWDAIHRAEKRCAEYLSMVEGILAGQPYLAGETFTLADIPLGTLMYRYFEMDVMHPEVPHTRRWYERLSARTPYRDNVMLPFEELRGRLIF